MKNVIITILVIVVIILSSVILFNIQSAKAPNPEGNNNTVQSDQKSIKLSGNNLTKIDQNVFDDTSVTVLDVSNNQLTGALPAEIRKLSNLEYLYASNNQLTGIPAEIGQLSKLKVADFSNNNISGLPLEIGNLTNLETLDLRGNPNISTYDINLIQPKIPNTKILTD